MSIEERNKDIVTKLEEGTASIVELGRKYNISRERVSQIYYKIIDSDRGVLLNKREDIRKKKKEDFAVSEKFICAGCGKSVNHTEGKYRRKYCEECHQLSQHKKRAMEETFTCSSCGKEYHPFANSKNSRKIGYFCSLKCYHDYVRKEKENGRK